MLAEGLVEAASASGELDAEIGRWAYVGDSTNDELMFEHFPHSVGVANIRRENTTHLVKRLARGLFILWAGEIPMTRRSLSTWPIWLSAGAGR